MRAGRLLMGAVGLDAPSVVLASEVAAAVPSKKSGRVVEAPEILDTGLGGDGALA